jgi:hypothetical protein
MVDPEFQTATELQARIRQTVQDLEEHCRTIPVAQRSQVKATIGRLKKALNEEQATHDNELL